MVSFQKEGEKEKQLAQRQKTTVSPGFKHHKGRFSTLAGCRLSFFFLETKRNTTLAFRSLFLEAFYLSIFFFS